MSWSQPVLVGRRLSSFVVSFYFSMPEASREAQRRRVQAGLSWPLLAALPPRSEWLFERSVSISLSRLSGVWARGAFLDVCGSQYLDSLSFAVSMIICSISISVIVSFQFPGSMFKRVSLSTIVDPVSNKPLQGSHGGAHQRCLAAWVPDWAPDAARLVGRISVRPFWTHLSSGIETNGQRRAPRARMTRQLGTRVHPSSLND